MMNPSSGKNLIDVACGTGDIGKLYLDNTDKNNKITCVDPNKGMVSQGKEKLSNYKNINWVIAPAEKLPFENNKFDFYTISFGLRNTKNLNKALSEAYKVLKPGGRYLCLEPSRGLTLIVPPAIKHPVFPQLSIASASPSFSA